MFESREISNLLEVAIVRTGGRFRGGVPTQSDISVRYVVRSFCVCIDGMENVLIVA